MLQTPAYIRSFALIVVGALINFLTTYNVHLDSGTEQALALGLTGLLTGVYYFAVTLLESRWPLVGLLLGSTARPSYTGRHRKSVGSGSATATSSSPEDRV
jgi:hypothetical protein